MTAIEYSDLKYQALVDAISYPVYKDEDEGTLLEVDEFHFPDIIHKMKTNVQLTNKEGVNLNLIEEILQLLDNNRNKYFINDIGCIGFYWSGLPVFKIRLDKDYRQRRMMYVAIKVYQKELIEKIATKKVTKYLIYGGASIVAFGASIALFSCVKNNN